MQRDEKSLLDILNSARLALDYLSGQDQEAFLRNVQLQDAVVRRLEIIGEAARRISDSKRQEWSHLPWQRMIGMRNIVIHKYDDVDLLAVWDTVMNDLPGLIQEIEPLVPPDTE